MLSRLKHLLRRLNPFRRLGGLRLRDYLLAAIANPREFGRAVRRYLNRRARMVEAEVRASEVGARAEPAPRVPQSFDALLARLSAQLGVLEIERSDSRLLIGVADVDLLSACVLLAGASPGMAMKLDGSKAHLGMDKIKARIQAARTIEFSFNGPALDPLRIELEPYLLAEPGKWTSRNSANRMMRIAYGDILGQPGLARAADILGAPLLSQRAAMEPVDAVYTWVNHEDPDWKRLYAEWTGVPLPGDELGKSEDAEALSRFHNNDELRYSLRSLERHAPWLRRIIVFTNCAPPAWMDTAHPRLRWVRHEEVIAPEFLPTFSSHVIESHLHRIPGLADRFIYLNDDFFLMRGMGRHHFFTETGQSLARLEGYGVVSGPVREGDPDYLNAARNSAALVRDTFGFAPTQLHQHVPYALLRPVLEEIETRFRPQIDAFRVNRFRRPNDINIPSFLYHHYAMGCGRAMAGTLDSIMVKSNDAQWASRLKQAENKKYYFVCINEGGAEAAPARWHGAVQKFLQARFPAAAPWERSAPPPAP